MPITPVVGPAGGGKFQWIARRRRPGDVLIDFTSIWAAVTGAQRDPATGKYPPRGDDDPSTDMVSYLMAVAVRYAVDNGLSGYVTTSQRSKVADLGRQTGEAAVVVDPGEEVVRDRLVDDETGELDPQCAAALGRWYA